MVHRNRKTIVGVWTSLLTVFACPAFAQPQPYREGLPEQQTFTEVEAVAYGLVHNPGLRAKRREIGIAEGEVISEAILKDAIVSLAISRERERANDNGEDSSVSTTRSREFVGSQGTELAAQRPFEILAARANLDALRLEVAEEEINLAREIKDTIAEHLAETDLLAEIHNVVYKAKPLMWEATKGKPHERQRVLMGFLNFQQDFPGDAAERLEAETDLNNLFGQPQDTRLFIDSDLEPEPIPIPYEDLKKTIFSRNIGLQKAYAELRGARIGLELAMRGKVPGAEGEYTNGRTAGEGDSLSRTTGLGISFGMDLFRQLVEQNRGEVYSAKSDVETAEAAVQATRWDVEAEMFELYWTLNLTRSRILIFEQGFMAQLEDLLLNADPKDYEAGKIDINTWERDFNRYHMRGEVLNNLKRDYKRAWDALEFLAGGSFSAPVQVAMETSDLEENPAGYPEGVLTKLGRGLGTILLSPIEIPAGWYGYTLDRGLWGVVFGPYEGIVTAVTRGAGGALDVATAPIPWPLEHMKPVSLPITESNPWTDSWSLGYVHPAYDQAYVPVIDQLDSSKGGN